MQPSSDGASSYSGARTMIILRRSWRRYEPATDASCCGMHIRYDPKVPGLFDGRLPDVNLGTNNGVSCAPGLRKLVTGICASSFSFSSVVDGRFRGGHITRDYGRPEAGYHALQMELAQVAYMDEVPGATFDSSQAAKLGALLHMLLAAVLAWCACHGSRPATD